MEKLINELCEHTGIDRMSAEKVVSYLRDNAHRVPALLQGGAQEQGAEGGDGKSRIAEKIEEKIRPHA